MEEKKQTKSRCIYISMCDKPLAGRQVLLWCQLDCVTIVGVGVGVSQWFSSDTAHICANVW